MLTTMPCNKAMYTLWGHTALRVQTDSTDEVYNYGVFSFDDGFAYLNPVRHDRSKSDAEM